MDSKKRPILDLQNDVREVKREIVSMMVLLQSILSILKLLKERNEKEKVEEISSGWFFNS
tara:strand:+ start:7326 stop:7505 length:180 start_codon:yes stop_codon:yes gene_type:complete